MPSNQRSRHRREYKRKWARRKYYERKALALERLGGGCERCGETDESVLQFDHIDPSTKCFNVLQGGAYAKPLEEWLAEVDKCQLLCVECHAKKTRSENVRWRERPWED